MKIIKNGPRFDFIDERGLPLIRDLRLSEHWKIYYEYLKEEMDGSVFFIRTKEIDSKIEIIDCSDEFKDILRMNSIFLLEKRNSFRFNTPNIVTYGDQFCKRIQIRVDFEFTEEEFENIKDKKIDTILRF